MDLRRLAVLPALAAVLAAAPAAAAPAIHIKTLQCDGSFLESGNTHDPKPTIQLAITDTDGLRITQGGARGGILAQTRAMFRFDNAPNGTSDVTVNATCTTGCTGGHCWNFDYSYADPNGSSAMSLGTCVYNSANSCATATSSSTLSRVPLSLTSCPVSPPATGAVSAFSAGKFAEAASFDSAIPHFASVPFNASVWNLGADYTMSAWVKATGSGAQRIISEQGGAGYWGFGLNNGQLRLFDSRDASVTADLSEGSGLNDGAWHMVDVVRTNGISRAFYIDGVQVALVSAASSDTFNNHPIATPVFIGATGSGTEAFNGEIDDLRVADNLMTADDIMLEYMGTVHKYSTNGGAGFSTSTAGAYQGSPTDGVTSATYAPSEAISTNNASTSRWIFEAQSTNSATTQILPAFLVNIDQRAPLAPTPSGAPTGTGGITWSWGTPPRFCAAPGSPSVTYQLHDAAGGGTVGGALAYPTASYADTIAGGPNVLASRNLTLSDVWGTSPLSAAATAYTAAAVPTAPTVTAVSTGSLVLSWGANSNPAYTRYEVTYSPDAFAATTSTRESLGDAFTGVSVALTGLAPGTTYALRVRAYNGRAGDFYGGVPTAYASTSVVSRPPAPTLAGTALGTTSIAWTWNAVPGAAAYKLYDASSGGVLYSGAALSATVAALTTNTRYDAEIEADPPAPSTPSALGTAFTYTLASPPTAPAVASVYATSAAFSWSANGNPAGTYYEVSVATDAAYSVVVATISVATTSAVAADLFPGATYYARVRALNGLQAYTSFAAFSATATVADPKITIDASPRTPYDPASGLVAAWQFDEASGTTAADSSGNADTLGFTCAAAACASTPTFTGGLSGLGNAASFSGVSGVAVAASAAPFAFTDSLSVEAWVKPQTAAQVDGAGVAARGNKGSEDFALDATGGVFRFVATPSKIASVSTAAIVPGQWIHLAGVYDSAAGTATLYLNGRAAATVTGVGARSNSGQAVVIGNRRDAAGNLTLPFSGVIDAVRVFHRALSAAEVAADYQGSFVSSVTPSGASAGILIALPPNAFGAPAQVYVSADPLHHPIRVSAATLEAGLNATPAGLTLTPNTLVEVVPVVSGAYYSGTLGSPATITIPYADADGNNLIDGTSPPLTASSLRMYTLNTTVNRWEALSTTLDPARTRATAVTPHFSIFALFASQSVGTSLSGLRVYPVPWLPGSGGRLDAAGVTFDHLPASGSIRILTLAGMRVRELTFSGADAGRVVWDGSNADGRRAASGVYFARVVSGVDSSTALLKFAIER